MISSFSHFMPRLRFSIGRMRLPFAYFSLLSLTQQSEGFLALLHDAACLAIR